MKFCPNCGTQLEEGAASCPNCGSVLTSQSAPAYVDPADHTAEFDPADISSNKVLAMLIYLASGIGVIIALLAKADSPYLNFHIRQYLKIMVCELLVGLISAVLCFTIIVPIAGVVCMIILFVVQIICFFQICQGKSKEPAIVSRLGFLK